ncbi:MAG TPA: TatD family hydrolase [Myxococcaceae bacterium]|nr:TatD family hydrolase [Myxococcaceae bacterium]
MILVDSHCHLDRAEIPDADAVVARARAAGLVHAVVIGQFVGPGDFGSALDVAERYRDFLSPTMGIHPHDAAQARPEDFAELERLCSRPEVVAVGEAGLDYYYDRSPRPAQREAFERQCALAVRLSKPLVVHVRDAHAECDEILGAQRVERGVIHCFTGDAQAARRYLDRGFFLSLSGIVTYKKTEALQEAVRLAPMERLLVETDTPFLAPVPHRGKRNEPAWVAEVARKVAELKGLDPEDVALQAAHNTAALFGLRLSLPPRPGS